MVTAAPEQSRLKGSEKGIFLQIIRVHDAPFIEKATTAQALMYGLIEETPDATPIKKSDIFSELDGSPVFFKHENYLVPGGSAKARLQFGTIMDQLNKAYHGLNGQEQMRLLDSETPLQDLLNIAFRDAHIVANSSGNAGITMAEIVDHLNKAFDLNIHVQVMVPESIPAHKLYLIEREGAEVVFLTADENKRRNTLTDQAVEDYIKTGERAYSAPTEPQTETASAGLAGEALEIWQWATHHLSESARNIAIYSQASSGPTTGAMVQFFTELGDSAGMPVEIHAVQQNTNGSIVTFAKSLENISDEDRAYLETQKIQDGSSVSGLSTKSVTELAKKQLTDPETGKLRIDPTHIHLVSEPMMKLAAALMYIDSAKHGQGMLPEKAGAASAAELIHGMIDKPDFCVKVARALAARNIDYGKFEFLADLTRDELKALNLEGLEQALEAAHQLPAAGTKYQQPPADAKIKLCIVTGANCEQPLEIVLQNLVKDPRMLESPVVCRAFMELLAEAHPKTVDDFLQRTESRTVKGVTFHDGAILCQAAAFVAEAMQIDVPPLQLLNHSELPMAERFKEIEKIQENLRRTLGMEKDKGAAIARA